MSDLLTKHEAKYARFFKNGATPEQVARAMVVDERDELKALECDVEPSNRAIVERTVAIGSQELGIPAPKVRFFTAKGLTFGGVTYREWPGEIWVAGDRPWHEQGELALHELAHVAHFPDDLSHDTRERDAHRLVERGRQWIQSAARAATQAER